MSLYKFLGFVALISLSHQANARYGQGGWIFGGIGAGGVMVNSSEPSDINVDSNESDKLGYAVQLKSGLSWYMAPMFVLDAMVGFTYSSVSGDAPNAGEEAVTIKHRVGLFNISPRFRFGDLGRWQIGPLYKMHFGSDTSFREREGQSAGDTPITHYLGVHFNYDIPSETERTIYRFGIEALTDISDSRTILMGNLLFEIGFNLWDGEATYQEAEPQYYEDAPPEPQQTLQEDLPEEVAVEELPPQEDLPEETAVAAEPAIDPNAVSATAIGNAVLIRFPGDRFQFATGMSHIGSKTTREYIRELGEFMARNDTTWEKASIVGHTDRRGPKGRERIVNLELSEARARTVYTSLVSAGMNASKMHYEGRAFDEPVPGAPDNKEGWKLNRRVEVTFEGVRAPEKIIDQINDLNKRYGYGSVRLNEP